MKKAQKQILAIYIRVSDPKQVKKGISLQDQEERGIAQAREIGWDYEIFKDAGLSGGLMKDRPKLTELIERIIADEIQGLYNVESDRLTREITEGNQLLDILIKKKIRFFDYSGERDLQLLDINMPVISGWDVLGRFSAMPEDIKKHFTIFILTSSINVEDKQRAAAHPLVNAYIEKPMTIGLLKSIFLGD